MTLGQIAIFTRAIRRRKDLEWYADYALHARLAGAKEIQTFEEIFPQYTELQEAVEVSAEAVSIMDKLSAEIHAGLLKNGSAERTPN